MSENNFDDNIRKKLESIRPEYSEAAWQKLKRSLPIPWYLSFLRDYGGWAFGGLATVAFLGSQYNNQTIRKENKLLNEKISILNTSPEIKTITDTVYVRQNDTVCTTRYVTRYIKVGDDYQLDENQLTDSQKRLLAEKTRDKSVDGKVQIGVATRKTNAKVGKDKSSVSSAAGSEKAVSGETAADKNLKETNLAFQANKVEDKVVAEVSDDKLKPARVEDISKEIQDDAKPAKEKVEGNELIIPENKAQVPADHKKPNKIDLSRINARFGI